MSVTISTVSVWVRDYLISVTDLFERDGVCSAVFFLVTGIHQHPLAPVPDAGVSTHTVPADADLPT